jgi:hypothetical protein
MQKEEEKRRRDKGSHSRKNNIQVTHLCVKVIISLLRESSIGRSSGSLCTRTFTRLGELEVVSKASGLLEVLRG